MPLSATASASSLAEERASNRQNTVTLTRRVSNEGTSSRLPPPLGGQKHLRQHIHVEPGLLGRGAAGLALGHAAVKVLELPGEALTVEHGAAHGVGRAFALAVPVDRRVLL